LDINKHLEVNSLKPIGFFYFRITIFSYKVGINKIQIPKLSTLV